MRRFVQTFVLAPQSAKKYYVRNDIFRYQDDISDDEECMEERSIEQENEVQRATPVMISKVVERFHMLQLRPLFKQAELGLTNSAPIMDSSAAAVPSTQSVTDGNVSATMNGTDHQEEETVQTRSSPPMQPTYQQVELVAPAAAPVVEPVPEKVEIPAEPAKEPEPAVVPNIPVKQIVEPVAPVIPTVITH